MRPWGSTLKERQAGHARYIEQGLTEGVWDPLMTTRIGESEILRSRVSSVKARFKSVNGRHAYNCETVGISPFRRRDVFDVIIENGLLVDGGGGPARKVDVGVAGGRIVALDDLSAGTAERRVDAAGLVVSPGFIDLHTHCGFDIKHSRQGGSMNYLQQGVTTVVGGNCGFGPVDFQRVLAEVEACALGPNLAMMIGHNDVRHAVLGHEDRAPSDDELKRMKQLLKIFF